MKSVFFVFNKVLLYKWLYKFCKIIVKIMSIIDEVQQKKSTSRRRKRLLMLLVVLWILFLVWKFFWSTQKEHWAAPESYVVTRGEIKTWIEAEWKVSGEDQVVVRFDLNEKLTQILKKPGDRVKKWEILARIDTTQVLLNMQKANNNLAQARSRYTELVDPLSRSEVNVLDKKLELERVTYSDHVLSLEHKLEAAENNLESLDLLQKESLLQLKNSWVSSSSAAETAKIVYEDNIQRLVREVEQLNQTQDSTTLELQLLDKEIEKVRADDDTLLTIQVEEQKFVQYKSDIDQKAKDLIRVIGEYLDDVDRFLWISTTNETLNDAYEQLLSAQNTVLLNQAETERRLLGWSLARIRLVTDTPEESLELASWLVALSDKVRKFWEIVTWVLNATATDDYFTQTDISTALSTFRWWIAQISQHVSWLQQAEQGLRVAQSSSVSIVDTTDDGKEDMLFSLTQKRTQIEKKLQDIASDKLLKRDEIVATHKTFENQVSTATQNNDLRQQEIEVGTTRTQIEKRNARDEVQRLKEELEQAKKVYQTSLELASLDTIKQKDPVSLTQKNTSALQIEAYEIAVREQKLQLEKTTLRSPVEWTVLDIDNAVGEYPSAQFMKIAMWWSRYIEVQIEEEEVNTIVPWQRVELVLDAQPESTYEGIVYYVSPTWMRDLNDIVQYNVLITYDESMKARSEMTVTANFIRDHVKNVVTIPLEYVIKKNGNDRVQIWETKEQLRQVMLGNKDESSVVVVMWVDEWEFIYMPEEEDDE